MAVKQLSDGNPDGTQLGQSASDLVGFYGKTPIAQVAVISTTGSTAASMKTRINAITTLLRNIGLCAAS